MCCCASTRRALQISNFFAAFAPRARDDRGRRAWAPDFRYPYGSNGLLMLEYGLPGWSRAVACGDPALRMVAEPEGDPWVGRVLGTVR